MRTVTNLGADAATSAVWLGMSLGLLSTAMAQPGAGPVPVYVQPIERREVAAGQSFVATVLPSRVATVGSAVDGRVSDFKVNEGDRVTEGQDLVQLLTRTIELERDAAAAELELRKEELAELENGTRPEVLSQLEAKMIGAKAQMAYMRARRDRVVALYENRQTSSLEERDEAVAAAELAVQDYMAAQAAYDEAKAGPRTEVIAQTRARVATAQAVLDRLNDQITKHTMFAPFDGYITQEDTEVGEWVMRGDPVVQVVALDEVEIEAYVVEQHVPHIRLGMTVRVEVPALPDKLFTGTVALVVPQADRRARTFPVKIRVKNEIDEESGPALKSGMLARVTLPTGARTEGLLVPKDSLVLGGPTPQVYVVDYTDTATGKGTVRPVAVQLGVAEGTLIQVQGELQQGQHVVVQGNERLRPGQEVQASEPVERASATGE